MAATAGAGRLYVMGGFTARLGVRYVAIAREAPGSKAPLDGGLGRGLPVVQISIGYRVVKIVTYPIDL